MISKSIKAKAKLILDAPGQGIFSDERKRLARHGVFRNLPDHSQAQIKLGQVGRRIKLIIDVCQYDVGELNDDNSECLSEFGGRQIGRELGNPFLDLGEIVWSD